MEIKSAPSPFGVKPAKVDKQGPLYKEEDILRASANHYQDDVELAKRAKDMKKDVFVTASDVIDDGFAIYDAALKRYSKKLEELTIASKKGSESVRDSTEKLKQGMMRIEKQSNFDKLEKYCLLLERAASAMTVLAELEKTGKLEKIINAVK